MERPHGGRRVTARHKAYSAIPEAPWSGPDDWHKPEASGSVPHTDVPPAPVGRPAHSVHVRQPIQPDGLFHVCRGAKQKLRRPRGAGIGPKLCQGHKDRTDQCFNRSHEVGKLEALDAEIGNAEKLHESQFQKQIRSTRPSQAHSKREVASMGGPLRRRGSFR